jgi:hypothetical protein
MRKRFPSTTNADLFRDLLDTAGVRHEGEDDAVEYEDRGPDLEREAQALGGWDETAHDSTTGVNGFLDVSAFSIRSNPPAAIRGEPPFAPRTIAQTYRGAPDGSRSILEGQTEGFPRRRSTRSQPL